MSRRVLKRSSSHSEIIDLDSEYHNFRVDPAEDYLRVLTNKRTTFVSPISCVEGTHDPSDRSLKDGAGDIS
jgi:hypothetical protein